MSLHFDRARGIFVALILLGIAGAPGSRCDAGAILTWGIQNSDIGSMSLDPSNDIYTATQLTTSTGRLSKYTSNGSFLWRKSYLNAQEVPQGAFVAKGGGGEIYGAGFHYAGSYTDVHLTRMDSLGNVQWARTFGGTDSDIVRDVAARASGPLLVGETRNALFGPAIGLTDGYMIMYDSSGTPVWQTQFGGPADEQITGVATDAAGNRYVSGYTFGAITSPNLNTPHVGSSSSDAFLLSYDSTGAFRWGKQFGTSSGDSIYSLTTDAAGNVIIVGDTGGSLFGPTLGSSDIIVRKYDSNGNTIWSKQIGGPATDAGRGVTTDAAGDVFVTGYTLGSLGAPNVPASGGGASIDAVVGMLDPLGNLQWWYQKGSPEQDIAGGITIGSNGLAYVTGNSMGTFVTGGTNDEDFIIALNVPEPSCVWLLATIAVAPALVRRRRAGAARS